MQTFMQLSILFLSIFVTFITFMQILYLFTIYRKSSFTKYDVGSKSFLNIIFTCLCWVLFFALCIPKELIITPKSNQPVIIWNDDLESVPRDNSLITLEFTSKDTIYIGPYDYRVKP